MGKFLLSFDYVISISFIVWFTVIFCLSIEKCFWKKGKSRILLFIIATLTSPFFAYIEAIVIDYFLTFAIPRFGRIVNGSDGSGDFGYIAVLNTSVAVIYILLLFLYSWLAKKFLGTERLSQVTA